MFAERVMEHLELSGFEIDESRAGHEEAPADPEPRKASLQPVCRHVLERPEPLP
jgi:hypothetical protein